MDQLFVSGGALQVFCIDLQRRSTRVSGVTMTFVYILQDG